MSLIAAALALSVAFADAVVIEVPIASPTGTIFVNTYAPDLTFTQIEATYPVSQAPVAVSFSPSGDVILVEPCDVRPCDRPQSIQYLANGDLIEGFSYPPKFSRFDANGTLIRSVTVPVEVTSYPLNDFDVDRDQCTVLFSTQNAVAMIDLCSPAGDWRVMAHSDMNISFGGVRFLPNDHLLVATSFAGVRGGVDELDRDRHFVRKFETSNAAGSVTIDPDGRSFWAATGDQLFRFDLATGVLVAGPSLLRSGAYVRSMAIRGEWRAALHPLRRRSIRH